MFQNGFLLSSVPKLQKKTVAKRRELFSICFFNSSNFYFFNGMVSPIGEREISDDLDLNWSAHFVSFFVIAFSIWFVREAFEKG